MDNLPFIELPVGFTEHIERDEAARTALYLAFALPAAMLETPEGERNKQHDLTLYGGSVGNARVYDAAVAQELERRLLMQRRSSVQI